MVYFISVLLKKGIIYINILSAINSFKPGTHSAGNTDPCVLPIHINKYYFS